jgi:hypothetical protein
MGCRLLASSCNEPFRLLLLLVLLSHQGWASVKLIASVVKMSSSLRKFACFLLAAVLLDDSNGFLRPAFFQRPHRAYLPTQSATEHNGRDSETEIFPSIVASELDVVRRLTEHSIDKRGTEEGLDALAKLADRCTQRVPYEFESSTEPTDGPRSLVSKVPGLLPSSATDDLFQKVEEMIQEGWISTNPDSVDGLPSFHLNLVSDGEPTTKSNALDDFQKALRDMLSLLHPYIYEELLPHVQESLSSNSIEVSDIFIRRYGHDIMEGKSRSGISAHYDVFSRVTSVVALDNVASEGRNGLYTMVQEDGGEGVRTSNHASLRRFIPLDTGDAVVHSWDVLHGVDVEEGINRASLIVWFTEKSGKEDDDKTLPPWLRNHVHQSSDNVAQFVTASALESSVPPTDDATDGNSSHAMHHGANGALKINDKAAELYLSSASKGNSFAMTRLGSLLEAKKVTEPLLTEASRVLERLRPSGGRPVLLECDDLHLSLARGYWYEAAVRGTPLAQVALADDLMATLSHEAEARLLSTTLFGLAAQQGNEHAIAALSRLIELEVDSGRIASPEDFETSLIVQTAQMAGRNL